MKNNDYILYIGGFLNEKMVKQRGLPTRNPAGSNRMHRIANSLKEVGKKIIIVSPAVSMRTHSKKKIFSAELERSGNVPVLFTSALGIPILGALSTFVTVPCALISFAKKRRPTAVIIYNFSPLLVMIALIYRYIFKVPIFHNIEDVSIPKINDWSVKTEVRPVQQLSFYFCMKIIASISQGYIIPTRQFQAVLKRDVPIEVITGCIDVDKNDHTIDCIKKEETVYILFSGKIEFEHGIDLLIEAMKIIENSHLPIQKFKIDICGGGSKSKWLLKQIKNFKNIEIEYHGFISDSQYKTLLKKTNICIALQNPNGRYGTNKTPSKVYEYLGNYKTVIATDVGDLAQLTSDIITICKPFKAEKLHSIIMDLLDHPIKICSQSENAGRYAFENYSYNKVGGKIAKLVETK